MTRQDILDLVFAERDLQDKTHGPRNQARDAEDWLAALTTRLGRVAQAATSDASTSWLREELVKFVADGLAAIEYLPEVPTQFGAAGNYAHITGADGGRAKIVGKSPEPPGDVIRVADDVAEIWVGDGGVFVRPSPPDGGRDR